MGDKRRLVFVLAGLGAGGAERVVALISGEFARQGHEVAVISFDALGDSVYHQFEERVDVVQLGVPAGGGSFVRGIVQSAKRVAALRRYLKRQRPDAVCSFLTKINVISVAAARGLDIPVLISERNNPAAQKAHPFWIRAWNWAAKRAAAVVLQTEGIKKLYPKAIQDRAVVIPNPIGLPDWERQPHEGKVLAAVGRLAHQKGFDRLIPAFAEIADDNPDWRLVIWGEGADRAKLEQLAAETGLGERISFPGNSPRPASWVETADAFVMSSRFEGFPNALVEAMLAGIPPISYACDFGPGEIITDGEDGLLVHLQDSESLALTVNRLISDAKLQYKLGAAARNSASKYGVSVIVSNWDSVIAKAVYTHPIV